MAGEYLGDFTTSDTVYVYFNTFDSNDPSASVTLTGLLTSDIEIYKDGSVTQRSSDAGYTLLDTDGIDFDGITGIHGFSIDLSDNTDAGFYATGSEYMVAVSSVTVDGATINFIACTFSIERNNKNRQDLAAILTDTGTTLDGKINTIDTNVDSILADTGTDGVVLANDAITAAKIAADAIGASELAADAVAEIADAIWDEDATGHQTGGTFGQAIGDPGANTETMYDAVVTDAAGTNVAADIVAMDANVDAILADTGTDGVAVANGAISSSTFAAGAVDAAALAADAVDEILDETIGDGTLTMRQTLRVCIAALAGKLSGAATTTVTIRNDADSANVIVATVDENGNRSAVTLTP